MCSGTIVTEASAPPPEIVRRVLSSRQYGPLVALPVYCGQTLHANAEGYGLLWTGFGVGAFAGVLTLTKLSHRWRPSMVLPMIAVL